MGRLIFIVLILFLIVLLLWILGKVLHKALQRLINVASILVNVAGAALMAVLAGLIAFFVLPISLVGEWFGIAVSGVAILVFVLSHRKFGRREGFADRQPPAVEEEQAISSAVVEDPIEPEADPRVAEAWKIAGELAPEYAKRLSLARRSCSRVLELAVEDAVEWSVVDCSTFISRTVPEAVSTAAALIKDAAPSERRCLADELVVDLERIAQRAQEEIDSRRRQLRNSWNIVRTHIASRTSRDAL